MLRYICELNLNSLNTTSSYILSFFLIYLLPVILVGQESSNSIDRLQPNFISPIDFPIRMSGSFAELRSNHFHSGIDIKSSRGRVGDTLRAVSDGYVSRIKLEYGGYGRALYIDHPSGYTTVYAHIHKFTEKINKYIYTAQKKSDSYALDLYLPDSLFKFEQGDFIAIMGNSGRSSGPHLHFEIRHTESEKPINPYLLGIGPEDNSAPVLQSVQLHVLDNDFNILRRVPLSKNKKDKKISAWRVGLSIAAYDKMATAQNKNGLYKLQLKVDDLIQYEYVADSFAFSETRQINGAIDYNLLKSAGSKYLNCYKLPGEDLTMVKSSKGEYDAGLIKLYKDKSRKVELLLSDYYGNTKSHTWAIKRAEKMTEVEEKSFNQYLKYDTSNVISHPSFKAVFPVGSLYKNIKANYGYSLVDRTPTLLLINKKTPLRSYITLSMTIAKDIVDTSKLCLYHKDTNTSYGGSYLQGHLSGRVDRLGTYQVIADTISPDIKYISKLNGIVKFSIKDQLKTRGEAKEIRYSCRLDGQWILGDYSLKTKQVSIDLSGRNYRTGSLIEIWATDDRGNKTHHKHRL